MNLSFWVTFGMIGQLMFFMRFFVQWIESERQKKSIIPISFWYFSLLGSSILAVYAIHIKDPVFITGQSLGFIIYIRNLMLINKNKETSTMGQQILSVVPEESGNSEKRTKGRGLFFRPFINQLFFVVGTFCLLSYHLGTLSLTETSEGRFGSIARSMNDSGDYLTPRLNGLAHFSKPPLTYWLSAIGMKFFGNNETGAKAFLPIAGAFTVLGCYQIGTLLMGTREALYSAFSLMTCLLFLIGFKGLTTDPLLTLTETWMVWALLKYSKTPKFSIGTLFWIFASLAMLTKGPPGLLPLLGLIPTLLILGKHKNLFSLIFQFSGWVIFFVVGLGWFFGVAFKNEGLFDFFIQTEVIHRVTSNIHDRAEPWYYFLLILPLGTFPWFPFLFGGVREAIRDLFHPQKRERLITLAWIVVPLIVFTLSISKRALYVLPLVVPCCLLIGEYLAKVLHFNQEEPLEYQYGAAITLLIISGVGLALMVFSYDDKTPFFLSQLLFFLSLNFLFIMTFGYVFIYFGFAKGVVMVLGITVPSTLFFFIPGMIGKESLMRGYKELLLKVNDLPKESNIIFVEDMLEAAPFYTGRIIPTWNVTRDKFEPNLSREFDFHDSEAIQMVREKFPYLLLRIGDIGKTQASVSFQLDPVNLFGAWGLYKLGEKIERKQNQIENQVMPISSASNSIVSSGPKLLFYSDGISTNTLGIIKPSVPGSNAATLNEKQIFSPASISISGPMKGKGDLITTSGTILKPIPEGNSSHFSATSTSIPPMTPISKVISIPKIQDKPVLSPKPDLVNTPSEKETQKTKKPAKPNG